MEWIGVWQHDLSPFLVEFADGFGIRWYGLSYLVGFTLGWFILVYQHRKGWLRLPPVKCLDLVLVGAVGGVLGARIGYVFFYNIQTFLRDFLYLFRVWEGGMSFFGGVLGAVAGIVWFAFKEDVPLWELMDAGALATPIGSFFGRIANFINGELWGRPTDGSWGVIFPHADPPVPRHPSQLYQAATEGLLLFGIVYLCRKYTRRPGVASMVFLAGYGGMRFLVEFYRAPDPHLGFDWLGLTRGQWFSLLALAVAAVIFVVVVMRDAMREPGEQNRSPR